jgi:hypothetical protein
MMKECTYQTIRVSRSVLLTDVDFLEKWHMQVAMRRRSPLPTFLIATPLFPLE